MVLGKYSTFFATFKFKYFKKLLNETILLKPKVILEHNCIPKSQFYTYEKQSF